jgi:hypothetical protein
MIAQQMCGSQSAPTLFMLYGARLICQQLTPSPFTQASSLRMLALVIEALCLLHGALVLLASCKVSFYPGYFSKLTCPGRSFAFPGLFTTDKYGRRALQLFTFPQTAWALLAAGSCSFIPGHGGPRLGLITFFVLLFAAFYSAGENSVPLVYTAECFPLSHRGKLLLDFICARIGVATIVRSHELIPYFNRIWDGFCCSNQHVLYGGPVSDISPHALCYGFLWYIRILCVSLMLSDTLYPPVLEVADVFYGCRGLNIMAFIMVFLFVPETNMKTLEDLDGVCKLSFPNKNTCSWS